MTTRMPQDRSVTTAARYAEFATQEARGVSDAYERLSLAVSRDSDVLALLDTLPRAKRQPNLLFGVARLLGGPVEDPAAFHDYGVDVAHDRGRAAGPRHPDQRARSMCPAAAGTRGLAAAAGAAGGRYVRRAVPVP